jgi:hypothetical protein
MDAEFMVDVEQEAEDERAAHTAFHAEHQRCREAVTSEEESDHDDFD